MPKKPEPFRKLLCWRENPEPVARIPLALNVFRVTLAMESEAEIPSDRLFESVHRVIVTFNAELSCIASSLPTRKQSEKVMFPAFWTETPAKSLANTEPLLMGLGAALPP